MNNDYGHDPRIFPEHYFREAFAQQIPGLILPTEPVWTILDRIAPALKAFFLQQTESSARPDGLQYWKRPAIEGGYETVLTVVEGFVASKAVIVPELQLYIGEGAILEPTVILKTPVYIGPGSEVRQGAYIRGHVIVGTHCTIGHNTEVKNSVFGNHTEAGHFAYVGDSLLGDFVNLGAGTKLANLPFRTLEDKERERFPEMEFEFPGTDIMCCRSKIGAVLADGVETGCNSTLSPGTFVGRDSWIYPCLYVRRGVYPPHSMIKPRALPVVFPKK